MDLGRCKARGTPEQSDLGQTPAGDAKARAVSEAVRAVYPACLTGVPVEEEAYEITAEHIPLARATETPVAPHPLGPSIDALIPASQSLPLHPLDPILAPLDQNQLTAFLVERNQLTPGQTYRDLNPDYANRILTQPARFLDAAGFSPTSTV